MWQATSHNKKAIFSAPTIQRRCSIPQIGKNSVSMTPTWSGCRSAQKKKLTDQGLKAKREAQVGNTDALVLLRAVQTKTQIEVETSMYMGPTMNTANLITAYSINNKFWVMMIAFITFKSSLVPLLEGL